MQSHHPLDEVTLVQLETSATFENLVIQERSPPSAHHDHPGPTTMDEMCKQTRITISVAFLYILKLPFA